MARIETWLKCDLKSMVRVHELDGDLFTADNQANRIGVIVTDNGQPVQLTGGTVGYVIRPDEATVIVNGSTSSNRAWIDLPASAYVAKGPISVVIKNSNTTIGACHGYMKRSTTDHIVDPSQEIPSLSELLAEIANMRVATSAANTAASAATSAATAANTAATNANTKASAANTAATAANSAATNANNKASAANTAAEAANSAATNANTKASSANTAATAANTAATNANTKASAANTAAEAANTAATNANNKASAANTAAEAANSAATNANGAAVKINDMTVIVTQGDSSLPASATLELVDGHYRITFTNVKGLKGETGDAFHIAKTYDTIAQMEADYSGTDAHIGDYVMVVNSVDDPDNAKVYIKGSSGWRFVVDMSGAQGIKGDTGNGIANASMANYQLTLTFTNGDTYTTPSIRGEKGDKGDAGEDGVSPSVEITSITGGHRVTIEDAEGVHTFDVMDGTNGVDGTNAYCHIRWAPNQPTQDSDMSTTPNNYMGVYTGSSATAPTTYTSYQWFKVKGETGSAENMYGNTIPMSSTDSTKVSEAVAKKITAPETPGTNGQVLTSDGNGGQTWQTPSGGTVTDVQEDGTSILNNGVANIQTMTGAGSNAAGTRGLVPAPASGDQGKFLKGDGTWDDVPDPQVMTGATSSTGGASGLVPSSQAGDQHKVLTAGGTWEVSPGAKLVTVEMTALVNESGSYSEVTYDERITPDMKPVMVEISNEYVFRDTIYIVPGNGQATLNCAKVSGSSTVTVTFQKVISDPTAVTSTEFDILNNRLMAVENVCTRHNVTIATTDWSSTAPYTYEWENSLINVTCSVKVFVTDGAEDAEIEGIGYTQAVGKVIFTTDELPVDDLPLLVEITNAKAEAFQQLSAEEISSEAITGCNNVEEALEGLDEQIGSINRQIGSFGIKDIGTISNTSKTVTFTGLVAFLLISYGGSNERNGMWIVRANSSNAFYATVLDSQLASISSSNGTLTITATANSVSFMALVFYGNVNSITL